MMALTQRAVVATLALIAATGCVTRMPKPDFAASQDIVGRDRRTHELLAAPLTLASASEITLLNNAGVAAELAQAGIAASDVIAASRLQNPELFGSRTRDGNARKSVLSLTQSFTELILFSARKRLAEAEYQRAQLMGAAAMSKLTAEVESAWYRHVSALQVAELQSAVWQIAQASSELAERFFAAGNISDLQLNAERSAAAEAELRSLRASSDASQSRFELQRMMGLRGAPAWTVHSLLPAPPATEEALDGLLSKLLQNRADVRAAQRETELLADALAMARRWRLLGRVDVGIERERELAGVRLTGPTLAIALPIFNQGQAGIARAAAQLAMARARAAELTVAAESSVRAAHERVATARRVLATFEKTILPAQTVIALREQQQQNFMFIGQFELLLARQKRYELDQGYIEAQRDYWLARSELARASGVTLPHDAAAPTPNTAPIPPDMDTHSHGATP